MSDDNPPTEPADSSSNQQPQATSVEPAPDIPHTHDPVLNHPIHTRGIPPGSGQGRTSISPAEGERRTNNEQ